MRRENRLWDKQEVLEVSEACVIIHNMLAKMVKIEEVCVGYYEDDIS